MLSVDFRRLNSQTLDDRYPIPRIHDFTANLAGCTIFSKVDLIRGYHQIPVHPKDVQKTAVIKPFGLLEFLRMPFGLKNAAQTFQRFMDSVLQDLHFDFVYLDDILVASMSKEEHLHHLRHSLITWRPIVLLSKWRSTSLVSLKLNSWVTVWTHQESSPYRKRSTRSGNFHDHPISRA